MINLLSYSYELVVMRKLTLFTSWQIQKFFKNYLTLKYSVSNNVNIFSTLPVKYQTLIMFSFLKFLLCLPFVLCSVPWLIPAFQRCYLVSGESSLFYFCLTHANKQVKRLLLKGSIFKKTIFKILAMMLTFQMIPVIFISSEIGRWSLWRHKHFTIIGLKLSISKIQLVRIGV